MAVLENFVKSYTDKTYKYVTTVRHKGTVVAFAMDDHRQIYYAVLDLNDAGKDKSPLDVNYWPDNPSPLPFGNELAQVGYGIIDPEVVPIIKKGTRQVVDAGKLRPEEIDSFLSTTARLSADAPFQVLSDNQYIYVFRQSIDADHKDNLSAQKKNHEIIQDSAGATVYFVNDTLLVDRFVLTGKQLHPKMEVRFKRSRNKYCPQSNKDSLGAQDMNKKPFREPTQELDFVENLRDGRFSVLLLPTQVTGVQRWQIFTHNQKTGLIDSFNVERSDDGLFNTKGSQFYTSPDPKYQKSVYEREPGTDPFTGKPLVPVVSKTGYGEYAIDCTANNAVIKLDSVSVVDLQEEWTIEVWFFYPLAPRKWNSLMRGTQHYPIIVKQGKLGAYRTGSGGFSACGYDLSTLSTGWHHLTAVGKDDKTAFYINGQNVGTSNFQAKVDIACLGNDPANKDSWGIFDELRVWNRVRSEAEIQDTMHARLEGNEPGLEAYWRFDEDTGNIVHDLTGNGHNGTLHGNYNWVPSDAPIGERPGIRSSSFAFDGRNIESGLSALLYYQQEKATTGYDEQAKPLKRNARVMLAAATANQQIGLVGYWPLDEGSGAIASDKTNQGNQGTINGATWETASLAIASSPQPVLAINGHVQLRFSNGFSSITTAITIEFWAKGTSSLTDSTSVIEGTNAQNDRVLNIHFPWCNAQIYWDAGNENGYDRIDKAIALEDYNTWSHWAFIKDASTGTMLIYRNGEVWHHGTGNTKPLEGIETLVIGSYVNGENPWKGAISELRIWNIARSQDAIQQDMNHRLVGNESGNKYIAAVDFAVSREGKLAQVPDNLELGTALSAGNSENLQRLEKLEHEIEDLRINQETKKLVLDSFDYHTSLACNQEWLMVVSKKDVYIFHLDRPDSPSQIPEWCQKDVLSIGEPNRLSLFQTIALQGEWAMVGGEIQAQAQIASSRYPSIGVPILYLFHFEDGCWVKKTPFIWEDMHHAYATGGRGIVSVAFHGEWAILGIYHNLDDGITRRNDPVIIFLHLEKGEWVTKQSLTAADLGISTFNYPIAISEEWAIIGMDDNICTLKLKGQTWELKHKHNVSHPVLSVAMNGEWAIVGRYDSDLLVFHLEDETVRTSSEVEQFDGNWKQKQTFTVNGARTVMVAIDGKWAAASLGEVSGGSYGHYSHPVKIFHLEKGKWTLAPHEYSKDDLHSLVLPVAINNNGDFFVGDLEEKCIHVHYTLSEQLAAKQAECDALQKKVGTAVALPMHLLHTDPFGLTVSGGLLGFANSNGAPQLFDSAAGKLALYYPGQDKYFFAAYYDTQTAKAQYSLQVALNPTEAETGQALHTTSLLAVACSADPAMDETQIEISGDIDPDTCTVTITNPTTGITETWDHVPRNPAEFAKAINGAGDEPLFIGTLNTKVSATVTNLTLAESLKRSLKSGAILRVGAIKTTVTKAVDRTSTTIPITSTHIQAAAGTPVNLIAYDYSQATTNKPNYRLQTGSLYVLISEDLTEGRVRDGIYMHNSEPTLSCQWVSDAPGKALSFDGNEYVYLKTDDSNSALANLDFKGDLTLEAWVQPAGGSVRIIHHHSDNAHYTLGLKEDASKLKFFAAVGETAKQSLIPLKPKQKDQKDQKDQKNKIPLESKQNDQKEWHHLAAVYQQSYGLQFDGGANLEAASSEVLNQDGDLTIEIFLQPANLATKQGLLAKGKLNDGTNDRVPYALYLKTDGSITFEFENSNGDSHSYTSCKSIQAGQFHKIAVTRKHQSKTNKIDPEKAKDIDFSQVYEQWTDICFYIDDQRAGYARYEGASPGTNAQPLEIAKVSNASGKNDFKGIMSEVRLWNKALSSAEIGKLLQGREQGLMAWWQFEENEGNVATDSVGGQDAKIMVANWVKNPDPTTGSSLTLYQDGIPVPADDMTRSDWYDRQFTLGAIRTNNGFNEGFRGTLEEVRIWKVARTQEQIQDNLFTRLKGETEYLIANYTFDKESPTQLRDHSLIGNDLTLGTDENKPNFILSTAPIGTDAAIVRSALAGLETKFQDKIDDRPGVEEYGDLQRDADGNMIGLQKRCYAYVKDGQWHLLTGYKVGNLKTEWISQVQFDPQVIGFIEGAPPVPSENMTEGTLDPGKDDCADASSLEVVEAENVSYTFGASQEGSFDSAFDFSLKNGAGATVSTVTAPLGMGISTEIVDANIEWNISTKFETSSGWSSDKSVGASRNVTKNTQVSLGGNWEDPTRKLNPTVGRRFQPSNMGFALVQSETADLFALRMEHNNALVCFRLMPNPDIPKDWNIIPFPINPSYSKQGTLDGSLGYDDTGSKVCDPDYPIATTYGEYSYFKPKEAYTIKNRVNRQEQELTTYYQSFDTTPPGGDLAGGGAALGAIGLTASLASALTDNSALSKKFAKRNLVNTYVWTADGGFFAESTEISENRQESTSGSFSFSGSVGGGLSGGGTFAGVKFNAGFDLSIGGSLNLTKTKGKDSETSFSIDVGINVPGDLQQYDEEGNRIYDANHKPINLPGKVDAYRFMKAAAINRAMHQGSLVAQVALLRRI